MTCPRGTPARALLVLAIAALASCAAVPEREVVTVRTAALHLGDAAAPPAETSGAWTATALPDVWTVARRRVATAGWYRTRVPLDTAPDGPWAVYLPRVGMNVAVRVNGHYVGDGGRFEPPMARNWNLPLFFAFPGTLLARGDNLVEVRYVTDRRSPGIMAPFHVGPAHALRPAWEARRRLQVTLPQVIAAVTLATGLVIAAVFRGRDPTGAYRWFAAGVCLWAWSALNGFVRDIPMPSGVWEWSQGVAIGWFPMCFVIAFHRVAALARPRTERALAAIAVAGAVALALLPPLRFFQGLLAWGLVALGVAAYLLVLVARTARGALSRRARVTVVPVAVGLAFGLHDLVGLLDGRLGVGVLLTPYIAPLAMLATSWVILGRMVDALDEAEGLNRELESRVRAKHTELERNYEVVRALERAQAVADERERIMRDVHDGMGGQLVSTLAMVERGGASADAVAEALRDALDDLRLVIDSLAPEDGDLTSVLGVVRSRLEPRLERHGLRFDWQVADLPDGPALGPERALQALRIVQEAITNTVKHARAGTVTVRTGRDGGPDGRAGVFVEVIDDGRGLDPAARPGRGLANMRRRAVALGGLVAIDSGSDGTRVRLWLPVS